MKNPAVNAGPDRWSLLCGGLMVGLGATVLAGRFAGVPGMVSLLPGGSPMAFMASLGFLLGGAGLMAHATGRTRAGQVLGGGLAVLGAGAFVFYLGRNHLGWFADWFPWKAGEKFGLGFRSPVSLTTGVCLTFLGVALVLLGRPRLYVRTLLIGGAVMFALPVLALIGYGIQMELYSPWWRDTGMAFPAALGLLAAASALVWRVLKRLPGERRAEMRALPLFVAVTAVVVIAGVTALVSNRERERVGAVLEDSTELLAALDVLTADCERLQTERVNARFRGGLTREMAELEAKLDGTLRRVARVAAENPERKKALAELDGLLREEFKIARGQAKYEPSATLIPLSLLPNIRTKLVAFVEAERAALVARQQAAREATRRTDNVILLGNALAAALGLLAVLFLRRADRARNRAMTALRESEERFRLAFDNAGIGMALVGLDGRWLKVNRALCDILGYEDRELRETIFQDLTHPDDLQTDLALVGELLAGKRRSYKLEKRYFHRDGHVVWARLTVSLVQDEHGRPVNFVSQVEDISELRQLIESLARARDEALSASRHKSVFLANMSHELRTPMNGVMGMASLLLDTPLTGDQREMGLTIQQSAESLLLIINDVLDFSKIEAGKLNIEEAAFDLRLVVEEALALLAPQAEGKRIALVRDFDPRLEGEWRGDAGRIRQVLTNLVGNAVKFTDAGEVVVKASLRQAGDAAAAVRFEVRDTGIGIAAEAQQRLFQPFTQIDGTTTRRFGGTGLGLAISRKLVELMGGAIGLTSEPGRGSVFWFELSLRRTPAVARGGRATPSPSGGAPAGMAGLKFLVVEDNRVNQIVARRLLEKAGGRVDVAENGAEALRRLETGDYEVILMDCQMPEMDGYTATALIRAGKVPGVNVRTPIIALTACAMPGDREKCLAAGMDEYVTKPLRLEHLLAAMKKLDLPGPATAAGN